MSHSNSDLFLLSISELAKIYGIWLDIEKRPSIWFQVYSFVIKYSIVYYTTVALTMSLILSEENLGKKAYIVLSSVTAFMTHAKSIVMANYSNISSLIEMFDIPEFQTRNEEEDRLLLDALKFFRKFKFIICMLVFMTTISACVAPIFIERGEYLCVPLWYPFDIKPFGRFEIVYIHQFILYLILPTVNMFHECLIVANFIFIGLQCDILCNRIKRITENPKENEISLKVCIIHHLSTIKHNKMLGKTFQLSLLAQLVCTTMVICFNLFVAQVVNTQSFEYMFMMSLLATTIMLLLASCWFSTQMNKKIIYHLSELSCIPN